ncbi:hypothetical protein [Fodinibius sp. AD559]|uniref:hypothetical protein n=1 Tax=Fodinibius sp. AD559 TaxID=3424179 RepID=UPI004046B124
MDLFNKRIALFGLMLLINLPAIAQLSADAIPLTHTPKQSFETVEGDELTLSKMQKESFILFLLPKPGSKSEGKKTFKNIRLWMKKITSMNRQTFSLLIVEPFKTSFPFYNIQKSKLKSEPYPVVMDKNGEILKQFGISGGKPKIMIADENLKIIESSPIHSDPAEIEKKVELINEMLSK